jgi:hypothetical protein
MLTFIEVLWSFELSKSLIHLRRPGRKGTRANAVASGNIPMATPGTVRSYDSLIIKLYHTECYQGAENRAGRTSF